MTVPTKEILADHLSQMIQMKTVSNSDVNKVDWSEFEKLHKLFETLYPHVYEVMEVDRVGRAGLQFHYHPKETAKKPLLLMSHQDVVEIGDRSQWSHDPFSGLLLDDSVYGRGTTDCKHLVLSELEALESLFAEGFRPDYVDHLAEKGVHIGTILDEGGGLFPEAGGRLAAHIGLGEKAAVNYEIYCDRKGGHSSKPGNGTALGAVAKAVVAIEAYPFPYRLTPLVEAQLAATAPLKEEPVRSIYADPKGHFEALCTLAQEDPALDAMLHTTVAFTMAQASTQPNVLPSHAAVGLSVRILQGDTVESVERRLQGFLPEGVKIRHISGKDPVPASTPDSDSYRLLTKILHAVYGNELLAIPFLMLGATDTRYYKPITDTVLLFTGHVHDNRWGAAHQVNEHIPVDALPASVEFFRSFLLAY